MNQTHPLYIIILLMFLYTPSLSAQTDSINWHPIEEAIEIAEQNQQFILIDVWAPWCGWCKKMENEVYPQVPQDLSNQFVWTRLNRDDNSSTLYFKNLSFTPLRLAQKLNVETVPSLVIMTAEGEYLHHTSGFTDQKTLTSILEYMVSNVISKRK
ncbi:MAG: DUF255 domain-containing protein [Bacteroidetes bacterium]|nr:DUF255 domain-containing protein [Bacteroidota bacterium]